MKEWVKVSDKLPEENQKVFYFFSTLGAFAGVYDGLDEDLQLPCFSSKLGFLCGDVTHWMPRDEDDKMPDYPITVYKLLLSPITKNAVDMYGSSTCTYLGKCDESELTFALNRYRRIYDVDIEDIEYVEIFNNKG